VPRQSAPTHRGTRVPPRPAAILLVIALAAGVAAETPPPRPDERVALLPPIDFNLEEDSFANEPISDADPDAARPRRPGGPPFGAAAPVSLGGFWAPAVGVDAQAADLAINAEFARVATPLGVPAEGKPLWLAIAKFGRLELVTDAVLPDSGRPIPDQLWLIETGFMHVRPLAAGGSIGGNFLFGSASDRTYSAGRDLTLMTVGF
jgi:hypothetical protein